MTEGARRRLLRLFSLFATVAVVASGCSSNGGGDGGDGAGGGGGAGRRAASSECSFDDEAHGGKVVYGLESDTGNPWTPANAQMAIAGHMVAKSVYDTLTLLGPDGVVQPNLATSFEPNDDFTVWTFTIRDGVTFHDGTPLDGAAVVDNIERLRQSFLTGGTVRDIESVEADGQTVTITLARPLAQLPKIFSTQVGYVASPTWLAAVDEDPTLAAQPVGTGPFRFVSYTPGNGNSYVGTCNPDYWREGLPRLDEVEFRVLEDVQSRSNALLSGEIDVLHTANGDEIDKFRGRDEFQLTEIDDLRESNYILLNHLPEVSLGGGDTIDNPLADVDVRRALAKATDARTLIEARAGGIFDVSNGPFPPGYTGYLEDNGYPAFDLEGARADIAAWEAENGDLEVAYATTSDPFNRTTAELIKAMWEDAGATVTIDTIEQTQFIGLALNGRFQAFGWRNHGRPDPVFEDIWWNSETTAPLGQLALNFGRISIPEVDDNLQVLRESDDDAERQAAAEALNRAMGEQAVNIWTSWGLWGIAAHPGLTDVVDGYEGPDGAEILPAGQGFVGSHFVAQTHWGEAG